MRLLYPSIFERSLPHPITWFSVKTTAISTGSLRSKTSQPESIIIYYFSLQCAYPNGWEMPISRAFMQSDHKLVFLSTLGMKFITFKPPTDNFYSLLIFSIGQLHCTPCHFCCRCFDMQEYCSQRINTDKISNMSSKIWLNVIDNSLWMFWAFFTHHWSIASEL